MTTKYRTDTDRLEWVIANRASVTRDELPAQAELGYRRANMETVYVCAWKPGGDGSVVVQRLRDRHKTARAAIDAAMDAKDNRS